MSIKLYENVLLHFCSTSFHIDIVMNVLLGNCMFLRINRLTVLVSGIIWGFFTGWRPGYKKNPLSSFPLFVQCCFTSTETVLIIRDGEPRTSASTSTQFRVHYCFTSKETARTVRDGEPRTSISSFTQLLSSDDFSLFNHSAAWRRTAVACKQLASFQLVCRGDSFCPPWLAAKARWPRRYNDAVDNCQKKR